MPENIEHVVRYLTKLVGPTTVKIMTSIDPFEDDLSKWLTGSQKPSKDQETKLREAYELIQLFENVEDARVWFRSENTFLEKKGWATSPRVAIKHGCFEDARRSARETIAELRPRAN